MDLKVLREAQDQLKIGGRTDKYYHVTEDVTFLEPSNS
jgi:hypothetical protein